MPRTPNLLAFLAVALTSSASLAAPITRADGTPYPPVPPWEGEPPRLLTVESPCPGPDCEVTQPDGVAPNALGRRVVYLNFDGANLKSSNFSDDATKDNSAIVATTMNVPSFQTGALSYDGDLSRSEIIDYTVNQLRESYRSVDVEFTTTRPTQGNYHMIVFAGEGSTCENTTGASSCAGIALRDCSDFMPSNIVFVFTWGLRYADLAQVAAHEGGHAFGLDHIDNNDAIMYYAVQNHVTTEFGAGPIFGPDQNDACNGDSYQSSPERLMNNIGPRGQDVLPPNIKIVSPANGATVVIGSPVVATVDDIDSEVESLTLIINGVEVESKTSEPWEFSIPASAGLGDATLRLEATDIGGNTSASQVAVEIAGDIPCEIDEQCPTGLRCGDESVCVPEAVQGTLGSTCTDHADCVTGMCGGFDGENRCTQACDDASPCPGGFECIGGDQGACWPADGGGGGGGGCAAGGSSGAPGLLLLMAAALLLRRRRERD